MLGHDDVAGHVESVPTADLFQSLFEDAARFSRGKRRSAVVAAEGYEVQAAGFLKSF